MLIKICGMRYVDNIKDVNKLPINFIGLIFANKSPRYVANGIHNQSDIEAIKNIPTKRIGVFVDAEKETIATYINMYNLNGVQLHGTETADYCKKIRHLPEMQNKLIFKAINISSESDIEQCAQYEGVVDMFVFDTKSKMGGGSGQKFDWSVLNNYNGSIPYLLSGGISPADYQKVSDFLISHPLCHGIDLNSKFEIEPALKDVEKLKEFILMFND